VALRHASVAETNELMHTRSAPEKSTASEMNMPSEHRAVRENVRGADLDIVAEVAAHHEQVAVPHRRRPPVTGAAVDRDMLADHIVAAEGDPALDAPVEAQILGIGSEDRPMADLAAFTQGHPPHQLGKSTDDASPADPDPRLDDRQGTDLDVFAEFCARINDSGRVDFQTISQEQRRKGIPSG
jgi:hypothetical protein